MKATISIRYCKGLRTILMSTPYCMIQASIIQPAWNIWSFNKLFVDKLNT